MEHLIRSIFVEVGSSYNIIQTAKSTMLDAKLAHLFRLPMKHKTLSTRDDVRWCPLDVGWMKINIDGSCFGSPSVGAIRGFSEMQSAFLGGFVQNIGHASALITELSAAMYAIERAVDLHYSRVWIESDSLLLVKAFNHTVPVPWQVSTRWNNCKHLVKGSSFVCTNIPREGNQVADALAKNGHGLPSFTSQWWDEPPSFLEALLYRDSTGVPHNRSSNM